MKPLAELYAFVADNDDLQQERVMHANIGYIIRTPLVTEDLAMIERYRTSAQQAADALKKPVRLVKFVRVEVLATTHPRGEQ